MNAVATFGENLKRIRAEKGYGTAADFAKAIGRHPTSVSQWENNRYGIPDTATFLLIAKALRVSVDDLLDGLDKEYDEVRMRAVRQWRDSMIEGEPSTDAVVDGFYKHNDIPVIAEGDATPEPNLFWDEEGLRQEVDTRISRPYDVRDPRAYGVKVRGDSMQPRFNPGDTVIVSPNAPVQDGDEVYVAMLSGERLLKIARRAAGGWILESINPAHPARFARKSEIGTMHPVLWIRPKRRGRETHLDD